MHQLLNVFTTNVTGFSWNLSRYSASAASVLETASPPSGHYLPAAPPPSVKIRQHAPRVGTQRRPLPDLRRPIGIGDEGTTYCDKIKIATLKSAEHQRKIIFGFAVLALQHLGHRVIEGN